MKRTNQQFIMIAISYGSALAILPFTIFRFAQQDWLIALIDLTMVLGMAALGTFVLIKRTTTYVGMILTILALGGMCFVVYIKGLSVVYWAYPTMIGMYFVMTPRLAVIFCTLTTIIVSAILLKSLDLVVFMAIFISLLVNNLFAYIFATGMHNQHELLAKLTRLDSLTGAYNRRALDEKLADVFENMKRIPLSMTLIMIDIDHFKGINDNFGHAVGDVALIKLVKLIQGCIRKTDSLYRYGGEEFVVVAQGADINTIKKLSEKLRMKVESVKLIPQRKITISLGVAEYLAGETADHWLDRADTALYKAKENGRNIVYYDTQSKNNLQ